MIFRCNQILSVNLSVSVLRKQKLIKLMISVLSPPIEQMKHKILYYHQSNKSSALEQLLGNIQTLKSQHQANHFEFPRVSKFVDTSLRNKHMSPTLKIHKNQSKSLYQKHLYSQYTSLDNSITSTINQSDLNLSIQNSQEQLLDQAQSILKKGELSPSANKSIQYLADLEVQKFVPPPNRVKKIKVKKAIPVMIIENQENNQTSDFDTIIQQEVRQRQPSDSKKSSIQEIDSLRKYHQHKIYSVETFGDLQGLIELCKDKGILPILKYFKENQVEINETIRKKDFNKMISQIRPALELCQNLKELSFFTQLVKFLGDFSFELEEFDAAVFFLNQCYIISEVTKNYSMKIKTLIRLSDCSRKLKLYQQSVEFLKKALIYTWFVNDNENEILCYDLIGLSYFYLGNLKSAAFFHEKWCFAEIEPANGYFRNVYYSQKQFHKTSKKFIEFFEQKIPLIFTTIDKTFISKLSLPIQNIFENANDLIDNSYTYCDKYKVVRYNNCSGVKIIEEILGGLEFTDYKIEYYEIQKRTRQIKQTSKKIQRLRLPILIMQIKQKYNKNPMLDQLDHKIYENPNYNLPLDQKIEHRRKQSFDLGRVWERVARQIGQTRQPYGIRQDQIYMKHIDEKRPVLKKNELYARRQNNYLASMLEKLAD